MGQRTIPETEPVAVQDKVRDVMLITVPGLEYEDALVDPDVPMRDDGAEGRFAKAYIHDEIPWMEVTDEVLDLMRLAVPGIGLDDDPTFADEQIPDDGMEACWAGPVDAAEAAPALEIPVYPVSIPAPAEERAMIAPCAPVAMLAMPEPVPFQEVLDGIVRRVVLEVVDKVLAESVPEPETPFEEILDDVVRDVVSKVVEQVLAEPIPEPEAEPEVMAIPAATVVAALPAPIGLPEKTEEMTVITSEPQEASDASAETPATITGSRTAVRFSFGSQEVHGSGWKVCFSF